jgi:hypothetical protein
MWIHVSAGNTAFNLDHVTRLFVEETGSGAALKAEIAGKTVMVAYCNSKSEAQTRLAEIMKGHEDKAAVYRM